MKKEKVYLCGSISHNPHYYKDFMDAEEIFCDLGYEVFNPIKSQIPPMAKDDPIKEWQAYMSICLLCFERKGRGGITWQN